MLIWAMLLRRFREWRIFNETYNELSRLDQRMLSDINILPDDIRSAARSAARRSVI